MADTSPNLLAELLDRHRADLRRYLCMLGCSVHEAEDLIQEAFLAAMQSGFEYRSRPEASAWLRRTAKNLYLNHVRQSRRSQACDPDQLDAVWEQYEGDEGTDERIDALRQCLSTLSTDERAALGAYYRGGATLTQLGEILKLTSSGAKKFLFRMRSRLRACVERRLQS